MTDPYSATRRVYEDHAQDWDWEWDWGRPRFHHERPWLDRFLALVTPGGHILELGCGAGDPVSTYLVSKGFRLTGVDYSAPLLDLARARLPQARFVHQDMRALSLTDRYNAVLSWDGSFHLTRAEQRRLIAQMPALLLPGAALLWTVGPEDGEAMGTVAGKPVYHSSLSPTGYVKALTAAGFAQASVTAKDPTCDFRSLPLATDWQPKP